MNVRFYRQSHAGREPHDISMKVTRPKEVCALMISQDTAGIYNVTQLPFYLTQVSFKVWTPNILQIAPLWTLAWSLFGKCLMN